MPQDAFSIVAGSGWGCGRPDRLEASEGVLPCNKRQLSQPCQPFFPQVTRTNSDGRATGLGEGLQLSPGEAGALYKVARHSHPSVLPTMRPWPGLRAFLCHLGIFQGARQARALFLCLSRSMPKFGLQLPDDRMRRDRAEKSSTVYLKISRPD